MKVPFFDSAFIGLRRSGNHAVIDWLLAHHKDWLHLNNVSVGSDLTVDDSQIVGQWVENPYILASFEDYDLNALKPFLSCPRIILLRDPFNLFASRLAMARKFITDPTSRFTCFDLLSRRAFGLWKQYAKEFVYEHVTNTIFINYNMWYLDPEYRSDISRVLGWEHTDKGFGSREGWKFSGGSSFGSEIDPLNSWQHFKDDEEFLSMFDEETVFLHEIMYGEKPDLSLHYRPDFHEQIDNFLAPCYDLFVRGHSAVALGILERLGRLYPNSTQINQLKTAVGRGIFHETQKTSVVAGSEKA